MMQVAFMLLAQVSHQDATWTMDQRERDSIQAEWVVEQESKSLKIHSLILASQGEVCILCLISYNLFILYDMRLLRREDGE